MGFLSQAWQCGVRWHLSENKKCIQLVVTRKEILPLSCPSKHFRQRTCPHKKGERVSRNDASTTCSFETGSFSLSAAANYCKLRCDSFLSVLSWQQCEYYLTFRPLIHFHLSTALTLTCIVRYWSVQGRNDLYETALAASKRRVGVCHRVMMKNSLWIHHVLPFEG